MNFRFLFLGYLILIANFAFAQHEPLSVEDAVKLALLNNPDLTAARSRVEQAKGQLTQIKSLYAPNLGFDFGYLRGDAPSAYLFKGIDARELPAGVDFNNPGVFDNLEVGLTARYNLWDGGRKSLSVKQAKAHLNAGTHLRDQVINQLIGAVIQTYFDVLAAMEFVEVAQESQKTVNVQLNEARVRHKLGGALKSDVLSIEVRVAEAKERLIAAQNAVELTKAALRRLLDLSPRQEIFLSGEEWKPAQLPVGLHARLAAAMEHRPDLRAMKSRLQSAHSGQELANKQYKPRLDLVGRYYMDDDSGDLEASRANWTVGAMMSWELGDGGRRKGAIKEASSRLGEMEAQLKSLERKIEMEVHQAHLQLKDASARLDVATANGERAEETLKLVKGLFAGGAATVTRYLTAETDRTMAKFRAIKARYDLKKAKAALGHVLGLCVRCAKDWKEE